MSWTVVISLAVYVLIVGPIGARNLEARGLSGALAMIPPIGIIAFFLGKPRRSADPS